MNILMISPQVPYPFVGGAKMVTYNTIKYLSNCGVNITLLALSDMNYDGELYELKKYCDVRLVLFKRNNNLFRIVKNLFSSNSYIISKYVTPLIIQEIDFILEKGNIELVHIERLHMAYCGDYVKNKYSLPVIFRPHNVESLILLRYFRYTKNFFKKKYLKIQYDRLYEYEKNMIKCCDECIAISLPDKENFLAMYHKLKCNVIFPGLQENEPLELQRKYNHILFVGSLDWKPNEDSLIWFVNNVFHVLKKNNKNIKFIIVGQNPTPLVKSLNKVDGVEVKGFVDDLSECYAKASIAVVPLQYGGGVKIKIIESLLMRVPVITTLIGVEGIDCIDGKHLLIAENSLEFINSINFLIDNEKEAENIAKNGFEFAKKTYDPEKIAKQYIDVYNKYLIRKNG